MGRLPSESAQQWVIEQLGFLVAHQGEHTFLSAPIRLPTNQDFPDPWRGDLPSLRRLCRRLLDYAGLSGLEVRLEKFDGLSTVDHVSAQGQATYRHHGAAAWFGGVYGRIVTFGVAERELKAAGEQLVGVLAHEVAHAYRAVHGLVVDDRELEERLTDLTTIYLGFGVFTVNNTHRYRTYNSEQGAQLFSGASMYRAGYLPAETMSFALGAMIVARELTCWQTFRLMQRLEPNQRGYTKAALRALRPKEALWARLVPDEPPLIDLASLPVGSSNQPPKG